MADQTPTPSADTAGLDADLQPFAQQVLDMDPFEDVAGPSGTAIGKAATAPSIGALPPDLQARVNRELADVPHELRKQREGEAVMRALKERVYNSRADTGINADSLPYHKADVEIAGRVRQLDREIAQFEAYLSDVKDYETVTDPATGEKTAQPIMRVTGPRREGFEATKRDLERQRRLLVDDDGKLGLEAVREKQKALAESARILKKRAEEAEDFAEIQRRVAAQAREKRIEKQVQARLNLIDPDHSK